MAVRVPVSSSAAKFNRLITESLTGGPKHVKEIYQIAQERQPADCTNIPCPHRKKACKNMEWQHEIQRQLARFAANREGLWHLKTNVPAEIAPVEPVSVPVEIVSPAAVAVADKPCACDPFIMAKDDECPLWARTGIDHFMDVEELKKPPQDRFVVPNNFDEFYGWKHDYVVNWVKRRLNRFVIDDEVEDWTQDLLIHLRYLPHGSKYRQPGANGRILGCEDVVETYDLLQQHGASERRFRSYINNILGNKFLTVQSKRSKNPVLRQGNVSFSAGETDGEHAFAGDEFVHANSDYLSSHSDRAAKQTRDRLLTNEFKQFVTDNDPSVYPALEALEATGTINEAAQFINASDGEFARYRNRLKVLAECFEKGLPVPRQRRPYKKRRVEESTGV
jgi:hypothetical protein